MSDLVTVKLGRVFTQYESELQKTRREVLEASGKALRREQDSSMRRFWYRTGASVEALPQGELVEEENRLFFRLITGKFYDIFGEYGTGRRGAQSGPPTPTGYRYGSKAGMTARRFSRRAIEAARPEIIDTHLLGLQRFVGAMTA